MKLFICIPLTWLLLACGGGGSSDNNPPINSQAASQSSTPISVSSSSTSNSSSSSTNSAASSQLSSNNGFVWIPDPELKAAILSELNSTNAEITPTQMQSLASLNVSAAVTTLTGLETATQLQSLTIDNLLFNKPNLDLSPLSNLSELTTLHVMGFTLDNLSPIENLQSIAELNLSNSIITDLSPVAALDQLSTLSLDNIQLTELPAFITNFTNLQWLSLSENPLTADDIAPLSSLAIRNLVISYTEIDNLDFLTDNTLLNYLNIVGTPVYDLSPLLTTDLANDDILILGSSCVHFGKYSVNNPIITQLENRGLSVIANRQSSTTYGDPLKACPNKLENLTANPGAIYGDNNLQITWNFAGDTANLTCEIYPNLQGQQPRTPISIVNNCGTSLSSTISTVFTNDAISILVWDGYGSKKLLSPSITNNPQSGAYLHSYDWGQTIVKTDSKLIPNKSVLLRLHLLGQNPTPVPDIQVTALLNNNSTPLTVSKPAQIPSSKNFYSPDQSYRVILDKTLMQPGLTISVTIGGNEKIITPIFGDENKLYLTLVPIRIDGITGIIPEHSSIQNAFLEFWPFSEIHLKNRAVFNSSIGATEDVEGALFELAELQILDGDNSHYYGLYDGHGGVAFLGEPTGIGGDKGSILPVMLHELGHNFNLQHVDCNFPDNPDPLYPYNTNSMGSLGINRNFLDFYQPDNYTDIMSYCSNKFVSDYSYEKAQDYLEENPSQPFRVVSSQKTSTMVERSWFISGVINHDKTVELRRLLPITKRASIKNKGQYQLRITDINGTLHTQYFDTKLLDHNENSTSDFFSLLMPYNDIIKLEILEGSNILFSQTEARSHINNNALQKNRLQPEVTQINHKTCLTWDTTLYESATLILHHDENQSTLFMDSTINNHCVDVEDIAGSNQWQILLRKGLSVDEFWQGY